MPLSASRVLLLTTIALAGCTRVSIGEHLAAPDYTGSPRRIFIINNLDADFSKTYITSFASSVISTLKTCSVQAFVYRLDNMKLNWEVEYQSEFKKFNPDSVLNMNQTVRTSIEGDARAGTYVFTLISLEQKRDIWKGEMEISAQGIFTDRSVVGPKITDHIVRQLVDDHVLKTCPPLPPPA